MTKLTKALEVLPLNILNDSSESYKGISRTFFPKWVGWYVLDNDEIPSEDCVKHFYSEYFWKALKCDCMFNQEIANLIFIFSVLSGKKKAIRKVQRVLNMEQSGILDNLTLMSINYANPKLLFLELYTEFSELYITSNNYKYLKMLLPSYYYYLGVNRHL